MPTVSHLARLSVRIAYVSLEIPRSLRARHYEAIQNFLGGVNFSQSIIEVTITDTFAQYLYNPSGILFFCAFSQAPIPCRVIMDNLIPCLMHDDSARRH
jgi:hypothetical protein